MKNTRIYFIILFLFFSTACSSSTTSLSPSSPSLSDTETIVAIDNLDITGDTDITLYPMQRKQLFLNVQLDNDKVYHGISQKFDSIHNHLDETVVWYSNDSLVTGTTASGLLIGRKIGTTTILATLGNKTAMITVSVIEKPALNSDPADFSDTSDEPETNTSDESESDTSDLSDESEEEDDDTITDNPEPNTEIIPEEPNNPDDSFLSSNDNITLNLGSNSGFGYANYPNVIFGAPGGTMDVLSLGYDGNITIELNDFIIVNGEGIDFTIFENPFTGWEECAEVAVSEDGITFFTFVCDQMDDDSNGIYDGCAGKSPVSTGLSDNEYLNPAISGGDQFDLDDLDTPIETVKYIMITDIGLCGATGSVPSATSAGFDFDAMAIVHGVNE
ncbi:hypothetical protein KKF63_07425 [bacterium]|nr:hypothetical protein [bacterium]